MFWFSFHLISRAGRQKDQICFTIFGRGVSHKVAYKTKHEFFYIPFVPTDFIFYI